MGRPAQSTWIIRVFAALLAVAPLALTPTLALATATAQGVALNAGAGCSNGNLDITLTTVGANWEKWQATDPAGSTFSSGQGSAGLATFTGTGLFAVPFSPQPPAGTLVASYAYVGEQLPDASNTAEFLVFYNCSTRQVLLSCFGPYGTCPQTAQQALAALAPKVPALSTVGLLLTIVLVAGAAGRALTRRT